MDIKLLRCPNCGATIDPEELKGVYCCPFCSSKMIVNEAEADSGFEIIGGCLIKYIGNGVYPTIPNKVSKIADYAFSGTQIEKIVIPDSVCSIGKYAFADCQKLKSVYIPPSVQEIGNRAFCRCFELYDVRIDTEIPIKRDIFAGTKILTEILEEERNERLAKLNELPQDTAKREKNVQLWWKIPIVLIGGIVTAFGIPVIGVLMIIVGIILLCKN